MKRVLIALGVVLLLAIAWVGVQLYGAFAHNWPVVDGAELGQPSGAVRTVQDGFANLFVLDAGEGKLVLIDAGKDQAGAALDRELVRRKLDRNAVVAIFLTHGHSDHTAACRLLPNATVYALAAEIPRIGGDATKVEPLSDGQIVTIGNLTIETFAVPGHTAGSAVYFARGVLFFGDSAGQSDKGELTAAVRFFSSDPNENVASLKALANRLAPRAAEITAMAFGHTGATSGMAALAAFANAH